jgi:hypothetical protein
MKKSFNKAFIFAALTTTLNVAHADRVKFLDPYMVTLHPNAETVGPVYINETALKPAYGSQLSKIIIQEAHKKAKKYLDYGQPEVYYAFITAALTVPMHEGLYVHFRKIENDSRKLCRQEANQGKTIKSSTARKHFKKAFLKPLNPFLAKKCKMVRKEDHLRQMISGGGDGSDLGIMQLSSRWHYDNFLAKDKFKSVRQTVEYGLNHLMVGFAKIYANASDYPCLLNEDGSINLNNVVRGAWAGKYNSGNNGKTCRFADSSDPHAKKDIGFQENLDKTLNINNGGILGYSSSLDITPADNMKKVIEEVINNHENGTNIRTEINQIL